MNSAPRDVPEKMLAPRTVGPNGFTLIDLIMALVVLAIAGGALVSFMQIGSTVDVPVQRLRADKEFEAAMENILADYNNNFMRSWPDAPPEDFDVCDESMPLYDPRNNATAVEEGGGLVSSLMLFRNELLTNATKYGDITVEDITCVTMRDTDAPFMQQLRIQVRSNSVVNPQRMILTVGR
ncbi:MAG: type II secretion system GspH family protein [Desulfovibrio sp.]|nr:type II secretion system GspH family protein [Desulfovibrio sp.]MCA1986526.1 type II secretion system GspH family protein [Desulfovibrio sp.]